MRRALDLVRAWPVGAVAAAVITADGAVDAVGPRAAAFPWASVTKLVSAYAVLVGCDEGALELDQPAGPPDATVRHLLAHASGLPFEGRAPIAAPGVRRVYSNAGIEVAAAALEAATGIPFWDYVREGVCEPVGMSGVHLESSAAWGAHGTLDDLIAFARECFAPAVVAPSTFAAATTVQFPGLAGVVPGFGRHAHCDWGLGFELRDAKAPHWTSPHNSPATFGHFGRSGAFLWVDPHAGIALACVGDTPFGDWAKVAWPQLATAVLEEHGVPSR